MMNCRRTSAVSLLVVALLMASLLTLHAPVACARHVVVLDPNYVLHNRGDNKNLANVLASASTDNVAANKGFSGRKLGAPHKEAANKAMGATPTATSAGSRPRTVEMRAAGKHGDAAAEMYDMLRRDYASKASRRRPINNGATPLQVQKP
ncbi:hypothetical protein BAE44_0006404 [Dichanthelium oligosanthes]|uniref:Root meristem growth factor 3 n=1 Tax=Dichanthelium oligosanthes TaxID=888268 RepID=A0A1E5W583_9POAL|nr:hypothetical protein BAE44_0006404 [Dichanthelium oligosanthes]